MRRTSPASERGDTRQERLPVDGLERHVELGLERDGLVEDGLERKGVRVFHDRTAHFSRPDARVNRTERAAAFRIPRVRAVPDSFRPVRVAIDARALLHERTGIGTYTDAIARRLAARPGFSVGLFAPRPFPAAVDGSEGWTRHTDRHPFGIVWLQTTLPGRIARWGADVLLSALTIGPARGDVPFVSIVHDLTPLTHPEWHAARTIVGFVPLWERTVERAARFACVSETTARDLIDRYPETASRVRVAPNGVDTDFFRRRRTATPRRPGSGRASATREGARTSSISARSSRGRTSRRSCRPASASGDGGARCPTSSSPAGRAGRRRASTAGSCAPPIATRST